MFSIVRMAPNELPCEPCMVFASRWWILGWVAPVRSKNCHAMVSSCNEKRSGTKPSRFSDSISRLQALAKRYLTDDKALVIKAVSDKAGK